MIRLVVMTCDWRNWGKGKVLSWGRQGVEKGKGEMVWFIFVYPQKRRDGRNRSQHSGEHESELCWDATGNKEKPAELLQKRKYPG